jgi:O-acetylhomoserine (thiol)-lyase
MAPMTAFQILQGIETLHLRMPRHVENTRKFVRFLAAHAMVEAVLYPELPGLPITSSASGCCRARGRGVSRST